MVAAHRLQFGGWQRFWVPGVARAAIARLSLSLAAGTMLLLVVAVHVPRLFLGPAAEGQIFQASAIGDGYSRRTRMLATAAEPLVLPHRLSPVQHRRSASALMRRAAAADEDAAGETHVVLKMLQRFLSLQFRPQFQGPLLSWAADNKTDEKDGQTMHRVTLTIGPLKASCQSGWHRSEEAAKVDAASTVLDEKRGILRKTARATLSEALQKLLARPLVGEDLEIDTKISEDKPPVHHARLRLLPQLQAAEGAEPSKEQLPFMEFEGQGSSKQAAVHGASSQALSYLLRSLACIPLLAVLKKAAGRQERSGKAKQTPVTNALRFSNVEASSTEEDLRKLFEECGAINSFSFDSDAGTGAVSYKTDLSVFAATRRLHGCRVGNDLLCVVPDMREAKKVYGHLTIKESGARSQETRVFFKNAPLNVEPSQMLEIFGEMGEVGSLSYWRDKSTGKFRGMGTVGYQDPAAAERALSELDGLTIGKQPLIVDKFQRHDERVPAAA
eukprot:TRINITY_DN82342_c0_g1_i1.p1 TRINITY_DN82342_c0_g1~~TRINITY_DN82342_c0_g1_i1.p1  ORF type:complete len:500 (+),score=132.54 TRINITY_DN82342_c0_g1_i1:76-1575(+)